jgi:hypothetical protein
VPWTSDRSRKMMFLGSKVRPVRRTDNASAICEQIVYTMWDPQHFTRLVNRMPSLLNIDQESQINKCRLMSRLLGATNLSVVRRKRRMNVRRVD